MVLAVLYFGLVELMLIDSARELAEARRFRARIIAETLAENAAERAARYMVTNPVPVPVNQESDQGRFTGQLFRGGQNFELRGTGTSTGVDEATARVRLTGEIINNDQVYIYHSFHN